MAISQDLAGWGQVGSILVITVRVCVLHESSDSELSGAGPLCGPSGK